MSRFLFRLTVILLVVGLHHGLDVLNLQDYCGSTITRNAGEIRFDAKKLPSYLPGSKCSVTISLQSVLFDTKTRVLFYFTKFDISAFCDDTNVTVVDGTLYSGSSVKGLPSKICGHNKTLENPDQMFTTDNNQLTVIFRRSDYGRRLPGNFSVKFVKFHTGTCDGQGTYKCTNGRCISKEYHCSSEINACGDIQDSCTHVEEAAVGFFDSVLNILRNLLWIAAIVIGVYIFRHLYGKYHGRVRSAFSQLSTSSPQEERRPTVCAQSVQLDVSPTQENSISDRDDQPEQILLSSGRTSPVSETIESTSSSNSNHNGLPSRDVNMASSDTQRYNFTPSCPPPSYEEVMANK